MRRGAGVGAGVVAGGGAGDGVVVAGAGVTGSGGYKRGTGDTGELVIRRSHTTKKQGTAKNQHNTRLFRKNSDPVKGGK